MIFTNKYFEILDMTEEKSLMDGGQLPCIGMQFCGKASKDLVSQTYNIVMSQCESDYSPVSSDSILVMRQLIVW